MCTRLLYLLVAFAGTLPCHAATAGLPETFTVNEAGSDPDASTADGFCDRNAAAGNQNECTLHAAIQQANVLAATAAEPTMIIFDTEIEAISSTIDLPLIVAPVDINGTNAANAGSGGRVDFNGADRGCFEFAHGAGGSRISNLVIRNCRADGISLSGHGYRVSNNRIGTNPGGTGSSATNDANGNRGISVVGSATPPSLPNISALISNPPANFGAIAAFSSSLQTALTVIASPTTISGNLISGNVNEGIEMFGLNTVNVFVLGNIIGLNQSATLSVPNGSSGIRLESGAYGNFIGPGNIISGQNRNSDDDGIRIAPNSVLLPNFVMGNLVGVGSTPLIDVGNGDVGVFVDTRPDLDGVGADNPTGFSLFLGPANTISDNRSNNGGAPLDQVNGDVSAGVLITDDSSNVRVYGNFVGLFQFPAGGSPIGSLTSGNRGNGIVVDSSNNQIGGSQPFEANLILRNARHGILVRGTQVSGVNIRGNFIGVSSPTGLGNFTFGNVGDGIHVNAASSLTIGGTGATDDNVISANGRHGIALRNGSTSNGWANLIRRNQIFGNDRTGGDGITGLGIDLDQIPNAPDPIPDPNGPDPNDNKANLGQNQPSICTGGASEPAACAGATPPNFNGSATSVQWTIDTPRPSSSFRIEFFQTTPTSQTFLSDQMVTTNASGVLTGGGCAAGRCTSSVGGSTNTQGSQVQITATDLFPADVPPIGTGSVNLPSNNTSEFSTAVGVPDPGDLRFTSPTFSIGEAGPQVSISVERVNGSDGVVGVTYATSNGTASTPADYAATTGTLSWANAETGSKTFNIPIVQDTLDEPNETVNLTLSLPTGSALIGTPGTAVLTITDDDATPSLAIADLSQAEGNSGTTPFVLNVSLSAASGQTVTVAFASANGSASTPSDYAAGSGTLTFVPGDVSETLTINVNGDTTVEPDETFVVNLSAPSNASVSDAQAIATIQNDDAGSVFAVNDVTAVEGNAGTSLFTFTVSRTTTAGAASVQAATANGTATAGTDYVAIAATTLNFAAGVSTQTFAVTVNGDTTVEPDETFNVLLTNASAGTSIGDGSGLGTITNDDVAAGSVFSVNDVTAVEGNAGTSLFTFTVSRTITTDAASIQAATANGSATAGTDYVAIAATTLNFAAGVSTQTFAVTVNGDTTVETDETFNVLLTNPSAGTSIGDGSGLGTITNDDVPPGSVFSVNDVTAVEGNAGTSVFTFTVSRTITTDAASIQAATANGTATAGTDYVAIAATTLNFAAGVATQTFAVTVNGDTTVEPDETFNVLLTNPSAGTSIGDGSGLGTITNDDVPPGSVFSVNDVTAVEGNAGTSVFTFTVSRTVSTNAASIQAATANGTATAGSDYVAIAATTLNFAAGVSTQTFAVTVNGDTTVEPDETFNVLLTNASAGTSIGDGSGLGTITNDDVAPASVFSVNDVTAVEGNAGTSLFTFTVSRTITTDAASIQAATANGTATAGSDYVAIAATTLNFAAGVATQTFAVTVNGDTTVEPDETFNVLLSNASAGTSIGDGSGLGTITNDDVAPASVFSINDVTAAEGNSGTSVFTFTVSRVNATDAASVQAATSDGTATAGSDYVAIAATTLNFAAGISTQTFAVTVNGDNLFEPSETFFVLLSNPSAGTSIADGSGLGTISNDDAAPIPVPIGGPLTLAILVILLLFIASTRLRKAHRNGAH